MKLVALVGLIDEGDCIGACIDHHLAIGFDHIVVTDLGSTDDSIAVVRGRQAGTGRVTLLHGTSDVNTVDWPSVMLETAIRDLAPDYVAHVDPDEFWVPAGGHMRSLAAVGQTDILNVTRYNVLQDVEELENGRDIDINHLEDEIVFTERKPVGPDSPPLTAIYSGPIGPKVMHRAVSAKIGLGGHGVQGVGLSTKTVPADLLIAHFPMSSYARFEKKIRNAAASIAMNPQVPVTSAWHWRRMIRAMEQGRLRDEYRAQVFSRDEMNAKLRAGTAALLLERFGTA